jgi:hypothetical protein
MFLYFPPPQANYLRLSDSCSPPCTFLLHHSTLFKSAIRTIEFNFGVDLVAPCFVFQRSWIQISHQRPAILLICVLFSSVLPCKCRDSTSNHAITTSFHILSNSLFSVLSIITRYVFRATGVLIPATVHDWGGFTFIVSVNPVMTILCTESGGLW